MNNNSLNSKTDGTGAYRVVSVVANPSLNGPDVLNASNAAQRQTMQNRQMIKPAVKVTQATQQAINYMNKVSACQNCKR